MALQDMKVYNAEIMTNTIELVDQMIMQFNEASGGAILLETGGFAGDFSKASFWQNLGSAQRRVDRYAANNAVGSTSLAQGELVSVKVAGGFGPVLIEPSQLTWLQEDPGAAIVAISEGFANALMADQLNTAVGAAVAAIENNAAVLVDVSATAGITQSLLNTSHSKFGDMSQMLITDVMTGTAYHKLIGNALTNGNELFSSDTVTVVNILGKRVIVTDVPALFVAGTPNKTKVLSLVAGGVIVSDNADLVSNIETTNGKGRIETTFQADYAFSITLKGYSWDITNGGKSPEDAELFTGTNWDKAVAFDKHTAGTLAIADSDL